MKDDLHDIGRQRFEERSRGLFDESVDAVEFGLRSRLNQSRQAALEAALVAGRRPWFLRAGLWTSAAGLTAALVLGVGLWMGQPLNRGIGDVSSIDDLDIVAASEGGSVDALDMLQDDLDFYDFADRAASAEPAA